MSCVCMKTEPLDFTQGNGSGIHATTVLPLNGLTALFMLTTLKVINKTSMYGSYTA